jgi:aspartyl-tRNA(Asn)/glutamyl-tRNA(Gln) amidotransferase subunit C
MPNPPDSSVTADVVRHVAALARLRVPEAELPQLTAQLARILAYVDQIREIPAEAFREPPSPAPTPVRGDVPVPGEGQRALESNARVLLHGYGAVPRVVGAPE